MSIDGRTARRDRNREAVLDAVLDLFAEDSLEPSAAEVAERSGVSLRSVYRYYDDMEALARAAIARNMERVGPVFRIDGLGEGPLEDRIARMVGARVRLYELEAPMMRATVARARTNEVLAAQLGEVRRRLRRQVEDMFAPELAGLGRGARVELAAALDVLLCFDSLEHLRRHREMSVPRVTGVLTGALRALLDGDRPTATG